MQNNIYLNIPSDNNKEIIQDLICSKNVKIERIISKGHKSEDSFWYEQKQNEFVVVLKGEGRVLFDDGTEIQLLPGDYLNIPAMKKHRVSYTSKESETVWLAVYY